MKLIIEFKKSLVVMEIFLLLAAGLYARNAFAFPDYSLLFVSLFCLILSVGFYFKKKWSWWLASLTLWVFGVSLVITPVFMIVKNFESNMTYTITSFLIGLLLILLALYFKGNKEYFKP
jgi:hypothetical protein